jgi:hypothetical protein
VSIELLCQLLRHLFHIELSVEDLALVKLNDFNLIRIDSINFGIASPMDRPQEAPRDMGARLLIGNTQGDAAELNFKPSKGPAQPVLGVASLPFKTGLHYVFEERDQVAALKSPVVLSERVLFVRANPGTELTFQTLDPRRNEVTVTFADNLPTAIRLDTQSATLEQASCKTGQSTWTVTRIQKGRPYMISERPPSVLTVKPACCASAWRLVRDHPEYPSETYFIVIPSSSANSIHRA